jgi:hypothetical protein
MEALFSIIESQVFRNWVIIPLAIIGFYQIFRGVGTIIENDLAQQEWLKGWMVPIYLTLTVLGIICLICGI